MARCSTVVGLDVPDDDALRSIVSCSSVVAASAKRPYWNRSFTEVPVLSALLVLSSTRLDFGLAEHSICSPPEMEWFDGAGLRAWLLSLFVTFTVESSSSSSSSFELLSSSCNFRLCPRNFTTSVLMFPTAVCGSCWSWAMLSWCRLPRFSLSEPRVSSRSSGGDLWGCSWCWFGGPPWFLPSAIFYNTIEELEQSRIS